MEEIQIHHKNAHGNDPQLVVKVPGKLDLMGEHTEYFEGLVLSVAVNKYLYVSLSERLDNSVRCYSENYKERKKSSLSGLKYKREDRWANYIKGAISVMMQLGCPVRGLDITVFSEIPEQVGLGSSSALTLAVVNALKIFYNFDISDIQLVETARLAEMKFMNKDPGITACTISFYGKVGQAVLMDTKSQDMYYIDLDFSPMVFLITDSHVPNGNGYGETEDLAKNNEECLDALNTIRKNQSLRDLSYNDLRSGLESYPEHLRRRCIHVVQENQRVMEMRTALEAKDLMTVGKLMNRSHESLRDQLEISCPELDWLVKRANETNGVFGSRMVGNGFGGCTINLINVNNITLYDEHLEEYDRIFGFKADHFICEPVSGVKYQ
ncbi:MAG: galactokinase [Spirochaetaceae bacterium 4572_59]|nr:MAG: galactokinase [Spirochaetaceae bacterium 4572_59]